MRKLKFLSPILIIMMLVCGCSAENTSIPKPSESVTATPKPTATLQMENNQGISHDDIFGLKWDCSEGDIITTLGKPDSIQQGRMVYINNAQIFGIPVVVEIRFGANGYNGCNISYVQSDVEDKGIHYFDVFTTELQARFGKPAEDVVWAEDDGEKKYKDRNKWHKPMRDGLLALTNQWELKEANMVLSCFSEYSKIYLSLDISPETVEIPVLNAAKIDETKVAQLKWGYPRWRVRNVLGWPDSTKNKQQIYNKDVFIANVPMTLTINSGVSGMSSYEFKGEIKDAKTCISDYDGIRVALSAIYSDGSETPNWTDDVPPMMQNDRGLWVEGIETGKLSLVSEWKTESGKVVLKLEKVDDKIIITVKGSPLK